MNAYIFLKLLEDVSLLNPNIFLWLKRFPYPQTNYLQTVTTQEKKPPMSNTLQSPEALKALQQS